MIRLLYSTAVWLAAPLVLAATAMRGPAYRDRLGERLGYTQVRFARRPLWVHAASVGEVQAAAPLVRRLRQRYPDLPLLVTTFSPTGAERVRALFGDAVRHAFLPYDAPGAVRRFLSAVNPQAAIVMEREIWPTLFCGLCASRHSRDARQCAYFRTLGATSPTARCAVRPRRCLAT